MVMTEGPGPAQAVVNTAAEDLRWQADRLPFMMGSLIVAAIFFSVATIWFFQDLQDRLEYKQWDAVASITPPAPENVDQAYRDWRVRAALEQAGMQQRFNIQATVVKARLWTRFMGFLTGMLLALTGCVFVLGKLRESIVFTAKGAEVGTALTTSSPGVFLALLGTIIISLALTVPTTVEGEETAVYLPRQVQTLSPETAAAHGAQVRPDPTPLQDGKLGDSAPPMPESVKKELQEQVTKRAKSQGK
jgi:hypothetical protein